jgi:hypothetical protein
LITVKNMNKQNQWLFESYVPTTERYRDPSVYARQSRADHFVTRVLPFLPEGHEILTRSAAAGLAGVNLPALLDGVIRPDRGGKSYWNFPASALHAADPDQQRRHSLRRAAATSLSAALSEIKHYLNLLYSRAMKAAGLRSPRGRKQAFEWIGEALHLIQDSYSQAHIQRTYGAGSGGSYPIRYIRYYNYSLFPPSRTTAPGEHNFPSDERDSIKDTTGRLKPEAVLAINASREYLAMMLRHMASPTSRTNVAELRAFLVKHFS